MRFASLASGSKGNSAVVEHGDTLALIDCGISLRRIRNRLEQLGVGLADVSALLVTHEHRDHVSGLGSVVRSLSIRPHMSQGTARALGLADGDYIRVSAGEPLSLGGGFEAMPMTVPHDVREPVMYRFRAGGSCFALATDIGAPNEYLVGMLSECGAIMLESNHDVQMLLDNPSYPQFLKQRILGGHGHLSNEQAGELLARIAHRGLRLVVAAHVSENNNLPDAALAALGRALSGSSFAPALHVAAQHAASDWFEVPGPA